MAGGKQTPRQRMMGILYLVLLGLIALDVPESLLDAFKNIRESLTTSGKNVQTGINNTMQAFEQTKLKEEPLRAAPVYAKAKKAIALSDNLNKYIDSLKTQMINESGGIDELTGDYAGRGGLEWSANLMIARKNAFELRKKINDTKANLIDLLDEKDRAGINLALETVDPPHKDGFPNKTWEESKFGGAMPMGAAMTQLTQIQTDTKNAESEIVKKILGKLDQAQVHLDQFAAVAVAPTSYVLVGQPYTAEVFLTAYDSKLLPSVSVGGSSLPVEAGKGKYTGSTSSEGLHSWTGTVSFKDNDGKTQTYSTPPQTYMVARPSAVVSPDKMNVLYIGVPNPVSVSAPSVPKEALHVNISGGSISGSGDHYVARVSEIGNATISVSGELTKGKISALGSTVFRVKRIPDPKAQFAGKSGGRTSAANIRAQDYLFAVLDGFEFDAKFNVTRFTMLIARPRQDVTVIPGTGNQITPAMHAALNNVSPGTTVVFQDIVAVGPDGLQRAIDPIAISANN